MTNNVTTIGKTPWSREDIVAAIPEFENLYNARPIKDNEGGMKAPHMFATWYMARKLSPELVVESGIWKGQSTWLLEQACPDARLISIDLNLSNREYISKDVTYFDKDFSELDWTDSPTEATLLFFDDHQNAYRRLQQCRWFGFRHMIFEDNYPRTQGDVYSLKKAFEEAGFEPLLSASASKRYSHLGRIRRMLGRLLISPASLMPQYSRVRIAPNTYDSTTLRRNLEAYSEFPPVYKRDATRWGDKWDEEVYPTPDPLLEQEKNDRHPIFWKEALDYTWICYARLKGLQGDGPW